MRIINRKREKFVSVRIAEIQLLNKYLNYLPPDIYLCVTVRSQCITEAEARFLNDLNQNHADEMYGKISFRSDSDYVVRLEDLQNYYAFIEVCYNLLLRNNNMPCRQGKCGFVRINSEFVVPYCCIDDEQKYLPLFYFEGDIENLRSQSVRLESWDMAYLKFCFMVQDTYDELFTCDSCIVVSLENIRNYFPPGTNFEEYWPNVDGHNFRKSKFMNMSGSRIRTPPWLSTSTRFVPETVLPRPLSVAPSQPVSPLLLHLPLLNNSHQNGYTSNQTVCYLLFIY